MRRRVGGHNLDDFPQNQRLVREKASWARGPWTAEQTRRAPRPVCAEAQGAAGQARRAGRRRERSPDAPPPAPTACEKSYTHGRPDSKKWARVC